MYEYRAVITKVYDGDTVNADIDLGWGVWLKDQGLRINRINAPELHTDAGGPEARDYLESLIPVGGAVIVKTMKDKTEKFGRMLAEIYPAGDLLKLRNVSDDMVRAGHALYWDGKGKRPV